MLRYARLIRRYLTRMFEQYVQVVCQTARLNWNKSVFEVLVLLAFEVHVQFADGVVLGLVDLQGGDLPAQRLDLLLLLLLCFSQRFQLVLQLLLSRFHCSHLLRQLLVLGSQCFQFSALLLVSIGLEVAFELPQFVLPLLYNGLLLLQFLLLAFDLFLECIELKFDLFDCLLDVAVLTSPQFVDELIAFLLEKVDFLGQPAVGNLQVVVALLQIVELPQQRFLLALQFLIFLLQFDQMLRFLPLLLGAVERLHEILALRDAQHEGLQCKLAVLLHGEYVLDVVIPAALEGEIEDEDEDFDELVAVPADQFAVPPDLLAQRVDVVAFDRLLHPQEALAAPPLEHRPEHPSVDVQQQVAGRPQSVLAVAVQDFGGEGHEGVGEFLGFVHIEQQGRGERQGGIIRVQFQKMNGERRLVQIFRGFVERVFLPQLKATDRQVVEWGKFSALLQPEPLNYEELQAYVDSFQTGTSFSPFEKREQLPLFKKKTAEVDSPGGEGGSFNPSKTFGGERARMMFPLKNDMDDFSEQKPTQFGSYNSFAMRGEDPAKKTAPLNPQVILPGLERLCKTFVENQQRIENMVNGVSFSPGKYH